MSLAWLALGWVIVNSGVTGYGYIQDNSAVFREIQSFATVDIEFDARCGLKKCYSVVNFIATFNAIPDHSQSTNISMVEKIVSTNAQFAADMPLYRDIRKHEAQGCPFRILGAIQDGFKVLAAVNINDFQKGFTSEGGGCAFVDYLNINPEVSESWIFRVVKDESFVGVGDANPWPGLSKGQISASLGGLGSLNISRQGFVDEHRSGSGYAQANKSEKHGQKGPLRYILLGSQILLGVLVYAFGERLLRRTKDDLAVSDMTLGDQWFLGALYVSFGGIYAFGMMLIAVGQITAPYH